MGKFGFIRIFKTYNSEIKLNFHKKTCIKEEYHEHE